MTRRHFEAIAEALLYQKPDRVQFSTDAEFEATLRQWREDVRAICRTVSNFNNHFDSRRFLSACGME